MGAAARLQANRTRRQRGEKLLQLPTPKLTRHNNLSRCFDPVNLKHVLRQIQTNHANLRHGRPPQLERINTTSLAPMMPSGAVHPVIPGRRRDAEESPE
jgi:hypothetical protein